MIRRTARLAGLLIAWVTAATLSPAPAAHAASCDAPANPIIAENCRPGAPQSEWDVGTGDGSIQGFATSLSVAPGERVDFKVDTPATDYRLDIYRMGYYGGDGARKVATVQPSALLPQSQPDCDTDGGTGSIDCGDWGVSASWAVPADAVSGIYLAKLVREDGTPGASHVPFVVRDDDGGSALLMQTSDTTWQAYNTYGGNDLYQGGPGSDPSRAYAVSYNRPFTTGAEDWLFNAEEPMVRWLERNGYDVSYFTGADTDARGAELREHRVFLSVGHDEYWSGSQRANVEAARDAGVNLAFFSGNECFWKTRWSADHRTLISYKETHNNAKIDPTSTWTGSWRDPRFSTDGGRPENALTGTLFTVNSGTTALQVPAADGALRLWRGTAAADQPPGAVATLTPGTLGYEWDEDVDNGFRPAGLVDLSTTDVDGVEKLQDYGHTYATGNATHHVTLYRDANGTGPDALVFGAGTVQWSWGLDEVHDRGNDPASPILQQATANLLADMGAQPGSLQTGLVGASASTDRTPPTSAIVPAPKPAPGTTATISGTAADSGGGRVGGVEVSTDGGSRWHPADGREHWTYTYTASAADSVPRSRAVDDSGNLEGTVADSGSGGGASPGTGTKGSGTPGTGGVKGTSATGSPARAARVTLQSRRLRASRTGAVRLRLSCPRRAQSCHARVRLQRAGHTVAAARLTIAGGHAAGLKLVLRRSARKRLMRTGALRVIAVIAARNAAGAQTTTRTTVRLLAPRRADRPLP
jgi:N,N-dimethylformamidase beta subunit-like, C-terminal